jgi:anti-sigma regulatory factor (Ser/Thr protein kinase)
MRSDMSFELAGGPYAVTAARLALSDLDAHVDPSVAFDVRLLVSELVTNSVKHAHVSEDDSVYLNVKMDGPVVRVEVRDSGPGFEPPAVAPPDDADEGWGLFLVEQLADEWGVERERQAVWFQIDCAKRTTGGESESQSTAA